VFLQAQKKRRKFKKADTNVISVRLGTLVEKQAISTGDPVPQSPSLSICLCVCFTCQLVLHWSQFLFSTPCARVL
jgi:hypothetical protein